MPVEPATSRTRLHFAIACLNSAADTITLLRENFESHTLLSISATTNSLLEVIKTVRRNKSTCALLMEQSSQLLYAISAVYIQSNISESELSPSTLAHIGRFTMTLHKIHMFIEAQQDGSRIRKFFRNAEMNTLLKDCNLGLQQTFDAFKIEHMDFLTETQKIEEQAMIAHQQVLKLIGSFSSSQGSLTSKGYNSSFRSSTSLSFLPSEPKIFHGRESELAHILEQLTHKVSPRIAILGPGGIGKTSLARIVLHQSEASIKYAEHRFFVACDAASTRKELESLIGAHLRLQPGKDIGRQVIHHLVQSPPSLLILDNMETVWEPGETRKEIEELLSHLSEIEHLALIITMRGAERPAGIQWTHPFLSPLQPLTFEAAQKTFLDIADDAYDPKDIESILELTDNLPLAVNLLAHAADSEGCSAVLCRWEEERTTAVSDGFDKRSSLDISISLSLSSPRFASVPGAKSLLSLLSILPDGLSEKDLLNSILPIDNILECKTALLRTSLAYVVSANRLKVLVPVREYVQKYHPPRLELVEPLFHKYQELLELWKQHIGTTVNLEITSQIRLNLANFQGILSFRFNQNLKPGDVRQTLHFGLDLNQLSRVLGHGAVPFMKQISSSLPKDTTDHRLEVHFISQYLLSYRAQRTDTLNALIEQAATYIPHFVDPQIQIQFYLNAAEHFRHQFDPKLAIENGQKGLSLARLAGDSRLESSALRTMALIHYDLAAYVASLEYAVDSQQAAIKCGDLGREASALRVQAVCWMNLGNYQMVISQSQIARSLLFLCGVSGGELDLQIMSILAQVHLLKSEYMQARDINKQILSKHNQFQLTSQDLGSAIALCNIAEIDSAIGTVTQDVQSNIDSARQILKNTGLKKYLPACETIQAELYLRDKNIALAQELLTQQLMLCWGNYNEVTIFCMERLADIHRWGTGCNCPHTWPVVFLAYASKIKQRLSLHKALQFLGDVILGEGDSDTASNLLTIALEGFTYMDVHRSRAECILLLGDIAMSQGNLMRAEELWKAARPLFEHSLQTKQVSLVDEKLTMICTSETEENLVVHSVVKTLNGAAGEGERKDNYGVGNV